MFDNETLIKRYEQRKADRAQHEATWELLSGYLHTIREGFQGQKSIGATRGDRNRFSSLGEFANQQFGTSTIADMASPNAQWGGLRVDDDEDLNDFGPVRDYLWMASDKVRASFGVGVSAFYAEAPMAGIDVGAIGNALMFSDLRRDRKGWTDKFYSVKNLVIDADSEGELIAVYRKYELTLEQAARQWGAENLSKASREKLDTSPQHKIWILHAVLPNEDVQHGKIGPDGMEIHSRYVEVGQKHTIEQGGYREFPFDLIRWMVPDEEIYGRGVGHTVLPEVMAHNSMRRDNLDAGAKGARPTWAAGDERDLPKVSLVPNAVNFGAIDPRGNLRLRPMDSYQGLPFSMEQEEKLAEEIRTRFAVIFGSLSGRTGVSQEELFAMEGQRLQTLALGYTRIERDWIVPAWMRRYRQLQRMNKLPPPPPELEDRNLSPKFRSPLSEAMAQQEAAGVMRTTQFAQAAAQSDPAALDRVDLSEGVKVVARANRVPAGFVRSDEEVRARQAQREEAAAAQASLAAAEQAGTAADRFASANQRTSGA